MQYDAFISYSHAADGGLAPELRRALRTLARRWYRPRALSVFLDETNLSASEDLSRDIKSALSASRFFIYLASPEARRSKWVGEELRLWRSMHGGRNVLIALTEGDIGWSDERRDFDRDRSTAVHEALYGAFQGEPLWVDLRWAKSRANLSPRDPRFQQETSRLAAPIHGKSVDELVGDDVVEHRRTRRVVALVIATLLLLLILFAGAALLASRIAANLESKLSVLQTTLPFFGASTAEDQPASLLDRARGLVTELFTPIGKLETHVDWTRRFVAVAEDCDAPDYDEADCPAQGEAFGADGLRMQVDGLRNMVSALAADIGSGRFARLVHPTEEVEPVGSGEAQAAEPDAAGASNDGMLGDDPVRIANDLAAILIPPAQWEQLVFDGKRDSRRAERRTRRYVHLYAYRIAAEPSEATLYLLQPVDLSMCGSAGCMGALFGFLRVNGVYRLVLAAPLHGTVTLYRRGAGQMPQILAVGHYQGGVALQHREIRRFEFDSEAQSYYVNLRGQIGTDMRPSDPRIPKL